MIPRRRALIVTAGRARGSLAGARALHRAGWFVGVGTPDGAGMVTRSRACGLRHVVPRPRGGDADFVAGVQDAVEQGGYDVVFGGGDDWMAALSMNEAEIPAVVAHPPGPVVAEALDKVALARRAVRAGLPAPRTELATEVATAGWSGPVIVKSRAPWHPAQQAEHRIEARLFPDIDRALERINLLRDAGLEPVLQEPVDGELSALIGLVHDGRLLGRVQQRSPHLWATPSGVSSRAYTVPVDETLADRATDLLRDLHWSGLVELQFLRDSRDRLHLIDLNGRFFGSMALTIASGPNLPDAWGRQVLGEPLPPLPDGRPGIRFIWTAGDLRRAYVERRGGLPRDVLSTVRWFPGATRSVWRVSDPGPTWDIVASHIRQPRMTCEDISRPEKAMR